MGVLDIRWRSERLAVAPRVQGADYEKAAAIRARANDELGRSLASGLNSLGSMGMKIQEKIDKRREDDFVNQYQQEMMAFNNGDGQSTGAMFENIEDEGKWIEKNLKFRETLSSKLKSKLGLTNRQYEAAQDRLVGANLTMQNQWANRAHTVGVNRELGNAQGAFASANMMVTADDADSTTWIEWQNSANRLIEAQEAKEGRKFGDEEKQEFMRKAGLGVCKVGVERYIKSAQADTFGMEDSKKVAEKWDEKIKAWEGADDDSFLPPNSWLVARDDKNPNGVNPLRDALKGADMTELKNAAVRDMKLGKKKAIMEAQSNLRMKRQEVLFDSQNQETDMVLGKGWGDLSPEQKAQKYRDWLGADSGKIDEDGNKLTWADALKKYDPVRGKTIERSIETYDNAAKAANVKKAKDESKELKYLLRQPVAIKTDEKGNVMYDAKGNPLLVDMTPQMRMDIATKKWQDGAIGESDKDSIISANRQEFNQQMKDLATECLTEIGVKYPKAVQFRAKEANGSGSFVFNPQTKVPQDDKIALTDYHNFTGDWSWYRDDADDVAYSDCIEALNLTQDWLLANPTKTKEDGKMYYVNLLQGKNTEGKYMKLKLQEQMARERAQIGQLQGNLTRGKTMSLGISPSGNVSQITSK